MMGRDELCALIPHGKGMCLLDEVVAWDDETINCRTLTHTNPNNPLATKRGLSSLQAVEYGAQAMAVHGGLLARSDGRGLQTAYLAALRQVELYVDWLNHFNKPLSVDAKRLLAGGGSMIYEFWVKADDEFLVRGRATVIGVTGE